MASYIYVLDCILYDHNNIKTLKIGSSNNPVDRCENLQTALREKLIIKCIYKINNYSAYAIDNFLKTINNYNLDDIGIRNYESDGHCPAHQKLIKTP